MQQDDEPRTSLELIPEAEITSAIRYLDPDLEIVSAIRYLDADLGPGKGDENAVRMVVGVCIGVATMLSVAVTCLCLYFWKH
jgi:hypothetical protein